MASTATKSRTTRKPAAAKTTVKSSAKSTTAKPAAKRTTTPKGKSKPAAKVAPKKSPIELLKPVAVQKTVNATFTVANMPVGNGGVRLERPVAGQERPEVAYISQDEWNRLGRPAEGVKIERRFLLA